MLSLGSFNAGTILLLLFPTVDAARSSSVLALGNTVILGIFVALTLHIVLSRCSKNRFFNCAFLQYTVGLSMAIIIMNWFQAALGVQFALLYIVPGLIGLVAIHCLWHRELEQGETNQLMGKVWNWNNLNGTKLKKFDGNGGKDDATVLPEDHEDRYGGEEHAEAPLEDHGYGGREDAAAPLEDHDGDQVDRGAALEDSDDDIVPLGQRAVQVLAIRANFPICCINGYDCHMGRRIYIHEGELQEEGMVDLVPSGPGRIFTAYGAFCVEVFHSTTTDGDTTLGSPIKEEWDVCSDDDEPEEYTRSICRGPGHIFEITYLVIPNAIETNVEVKLKLKDISSRSCAVYGKIKASATDFGNKSVHLFSCERGSRWFVDSGPTSILPLSPAVIALPYRRQLELHIEVDLTVITIFDNQKEDDKNLKFSLKLTRGITGQEREVDGDRFEVNITFDPKI